MYPEDNNIIKLSNHTLMQKKQHDGLNFDEKNQYLVIPDMNKIRFTYVKNKRKKIAPDYYFGTKEEATVLSHTDVEKWVQKLSMLELITEKKGSVVFA